MKYIFKLLIFFFSLPLFGQGIDSYIGNSNNGFDMFGNGKGVIGSNNIVDLYNDSADVLFARWVDQGNSTLKSLYSQWYDTIQFYNIDDSCDCGYKFDVHTSQAALLDIFNKSRTATAVNSPAFTAFKGFTTDATNTKYVNANFNPVTNGKHYILNSASIVIWINTNLYTTAKALWGSASDEGFTLVTDNYIQGANLRFRINNNGITYQDVAHNNNISGFTITTRQSNTTIAYARNSATYSTASKASSSMINLPFFIGCMNVNGTPTYISLNQYSSWFACGQLTQLQSTKLYQAEWLWHRGVFTLGLSKSATSITALGMPLTTAQLDALLLEMDNFYTGSNLMTQNCTITLNNLNIQPPTGGASNTSIVSLIAKATSQGKTWTFLINTP